MEVEEVDARNSAATFEDDDTAAELEEEDEVDVEELDAAAAVVIVSPTRTYFPSANPFSTSSAEMTWPLSSKTVTTGPGTVVVVAARRSRGEPCLAR